MENVWNHNVMNIKDEEEIVGVMEIRNGCKRPTKPVQLSKAEFIVNLSTGP